MSWVFDRKLRACIDAPLGPVHTRPDTRVVQRDGWFQRITPSAPGTKNNEVLISSVNDGGRRTCRDPTVFAGAIDRLDPAMDLRGREHVERAFSLDAMVQMRGS